ncbi:MAG: hypothetical protein HPY50_06775 [Firmicutes bacterium]|nr:hypothetical protein [Bacillota bacterium]
MKCPVCNGIQTGKVGVDQFYCWNCFVEFSTSNDLVEIFEVLEDGSLINMTPLEFNAARG